MTQLEREAIMPRISGIQKNLQRLHVLGKLNFEEFRADDPFALAQHHLRLTLEGIFHIGAHILSRLPGERSVEYSGIAKNLGDANIVSKEFAEKKLVPMAKMRNILVHHYADIDPKKIYEMINEHLGDVETFLQAVVRVVEHPENFGLTIE